MCPISKLGRQNDLRRRADDTPRRAAEILDLYRCDVIPYLKNYAPGAFMKPRLIVATILCASSLAFARTQEIIGPECAAMVRDPYPYPPNRP